MANIEPILKENKNRFVINQIKHHDIWDWYKKMEDSFWTAEEIDFQQITVSNMIFYLIDFQLFKKYKELKKP